MRAGMTGVQPATLIASSVMGATGFRLWVRPSRSSRFRGL